MEVMKKLSWQWIQYTLGSHKLSSGLYLANHMQKLHMQLIIIIDGKIIYGTFLKRC
jgi:hypothetical protein